MLCKIWGFHGGDYEECRLLGYRNPVRTSQEIYYISATEPSRLMLFKIWGFHGGDSEECRLLGCNTVWTLVRTDVLKEHFASIVGVKGISELRKRLAATSNWILERIASIIKATRNDELGRTLAVTSRLVPIESKGFFRSCITLIINGVLDFVHLPEF
jgi:hypothetical protein